MAKLSCQTFSWISTLLVMRILQPEDYGLIAMAAVLVSLLTMVNEMGLGQAIIQSDNLNQTKIRQCFGIVVLVNLSSYVVLCILAPILAWFFSEDKLSLIIPVIGVQFLIQIFLVIPSALLDKQLRFRERAIYEVGTSLSGTLATLGMAYSGFGIWSIIFGNLCMVTCYTALINWKFPFPHLPTFKFSGIGDMARFGLMTVLGRILWFFYSQADTLLVGRLLGKSVLGFYSVGVQVATLPLVKISAIFNQLAMAGYSQIKNDIQRLRDSVLLVARVASFLSVPIFWGIAAIANDFVQLFLGSTWEPAVLPLQCIAIMLPFRVLSIALSQVVNAVGRPELNVINMAVACVVMPVSFFIAIQLWGLPGICYAWVVIYPIWFIYALRQGLPTVGLTLREYCRNVAVPYLFGALMLVLVISVRNLLPIEGWQRLITLIAIGATAYSSLCWILAHEYSRGVIAAFRIDKTELHPIQILEEPQP